MADQFMKDIQVTIRPIHLEGDLTSRLLHLQELFPKCHIVLENCWPAGPLSEWRASMFVPVEGNLQGLEIRRETRMTPDSAFGALYNVLILILNAELRGESWKPPYLYKILDNCIAFKRVPGWVVVAATKQESTKQESTKQEKEHDHAES